MSLAEDTTAKLWQRFMPRRGEVSNRVADEYVSLQVHDGRAAEFFTPESMFDKWALVEVSADDEIPDGMESYAMNGGLYAVFIHEGPASTAPETMRFIFSEWLQKPEYELDAREHFEVLPEGYDPQDPEAREEVWIPIRQT